MQTSSAVCHPLPPVTPDPAIAQTLRWMFTVGWQLLAHCLHRSQGKGLQGVSLLVPDRMTRVIFPLHEYD